MIIKNKQKSFTLIELLVVIVIIGILAGVIMISTSSSIDKANFVKAQAFSSTVQNELLSNLVSEWTFDEGSNQTVNRIATNDDVKDTWGSNHGTINGDPILKGEDDCVFKKCLYLDENDTIHILGSNFKNNDLAITEEITISSWVKKNKNNGDEMIVSKTNSYLLAINSGNLIYFNYHNGNAWVGATYSKNKILDFDWHYIVAMFEKNSGNSKIFLDGALNNGSIVEKSSINISTYKFLIGGCEGWNEQWNFSGLIDDIRIYNATMSSSQIKQNYIAGLNSMLANGNISKQEYNERINSLSIK